MPTRIILMAKGFAKPSFTIYLMEVKFIAKNILVPSNARCAFVFDFNKLDLYIQSWGKYNKKPSLEKDGFNT